MDNGKQTVVIIDEAHLIEDKLIFEELRLLLNFQYKNKFLLTLILLGQPELKEKINNIKQLQQRVAIKYHLGALSEPESAEYVNHRLRTAGGARKIFDDKSLKMIYGQSGGIPAGSIRSAIWRYSPVSASARKYWAKKRLWKWLRIWKDKEKSLTLAYKGIYLI